MSTDPTPGHPGKRSRPDHPTQPEASAPPEKSPQAAENAPREDGPPDEAALRECAPREDGPPDEAALRECAAREDGPPGEAALREGGLPGQSATREGGPPGENASVPAATPGGSPARSDGLREPPGASSPGRCAAREDGPLGEGASALDRTSGGSPARADGGSEPTASSAPGTGPTPVAPARRRVLWIGGGALLVVVLGLVLLGWDGPLPRPRVLGRDPVPADRLHPIDPPDCGVTAATRKALVPDPWIDADGTGGRCSWGSASADDSLERTLTVSFTRSEAGTDGSAVARAMSEFAAAARSTAQARPIAGLGDEAFDAPGPNPVGDARRLVFRAGNLTATVEYEVETYPGEDAPEASPARIRASTLRAAADVARGLGAPANPRDTRPAPAPRQVALPESLCRLVPDDLRNRLVGDDPDESADNGDPLAREEPPPGARARSCGLRATGRQLVVAMTITPDTPAFATQGAEREYLRRYRDARAITPLSARDERYFHALTGLGDRAFAAYLEGRPPPAVGSDRTAQVVVRTGSALVTVAYGSVHGEEDAGPLTREEAVTGAYAVASRVTGGLR